MSRISKAAQISCLDQQNTALCGEIALFERDRDAAFRLFNEKAKLCRTRAKIAWKRGKKTTHAKLNACARVWEIAASEVNAINPPF